MNIQSTSDLNLTIIIGQVHAIDDNYLIYSLNSNIFQINSQTGEIYLIKSLTINMIDQNLTFNVYVTDGEFQSKTNVTILIQGYNHSPEFEKEEYYFEIYENISIRTTIGQIIANDKDLSTTPRGQLIYSLHSITSYSEFFFHITHQGYIIITRIPDAEQQQIHQFYVIVKDHGTPPLSNQTKLLIKINDINEYCPKIVKKSTEPYLFLSREEFLIKNSFKYNLSAFDEDISDQSNIKFSLISLIYSDFFHLNSNGLLILKKFPLKIPLIIQLQYSLTDQFYPQPCITKDKLIILIHETLDDCYRLLNQSEKKFNHIQKSQLIIQKSKNLEIIFSFFIFTLFILILLISIIYLLFILYHQWQEKRKRKRSITTKSSYIINPSLLFDDNKKQSEPTFTIDSNRKCSCTASIIYC
jgi:hypothetical protein